MWIYLVILLGLSALAANVTGRSPRSQDPSDCIRPQADASTCVAIRSHYVPAGTRRPARRRRRADTRPAADRPG